MFDIGFWEIALIAVVALLVVGPEEFPRLVRTIGAVLGKIRRFVQDAKRELDREVLQAEELKRLMEEEARIAELHEVAEDLNSTIPVNVPAKKKVEKKQEKKLAGSRAVADGLETKLGTGSGSGSGADAGTESGAESGSESGAGQERTALRQGADGAGLDERAAVKRRDDGAAEEVSS